MNTEIKEGLEGVVAFRTEIAEPDREGGALRYRGVDIEELVGKVPFEQVWGLLVDEALEPGMPVAEEVEPVAHTGQPMLDLQASLAHLAGTWGLKYSIDVGVEQLREDVARLSAATLSLVAQIARGGDRPAVPKSEVDQGQNAAERFLLQWRGELDERAGTAIDAYFASAAEHGLNASTFTARVVISTGAGAGEALSAAVGALSGPLHGGAPTRVLRMLDEVANTDTEQYVKGLLDRGERLMGFGHRVYRAEDPRARVLRRTAKELGSPRFEAAEELEQVALAELRERHPERVLATNVEFWSAVVLDVAGVPHELFPSMFACSRTAGWSAHILEQKQLGKLVRPSAQYVGPGARSLAEV
jgi:citrate synthase